MAQTIKIKRSTGSSAPSTLANGELAYLNNSANKKLYIGRPGGGTGDIDVIGGKDFTDKLNLIGAANGTNAADASVVASANNLGVIRIGDGLSIAANGEVSADEVTSTSVTNAGALMDSEVTNLAQVKAFSSADYATAAQGTLATNALPKAGGTLTGNLSFGDNVKAQFGASDDLQIYHDGNNSIIKDAGSGVLRYTSSSSSAAGVVFEIENTDTDAASGSFIHFKDSSGLDPCKIGAVGSSFFVMSPTNEYMIKANSNSDVELYHDNVKKLETTTDGIAVSGDADISGDLTAGNFTFTGDEISSSGSTMTLDPHADGITGKVVVNGDLEVKGTTTTINSTQVTINDAYIQLNSGLGAGDTPASSMICGFEVNRGAGETGRTHDAGLYWYESGDEWRVSEGQTASHALIHANNFESVVTTLDGGTF